jgi:thiol-disulfide isomerase/thioredoxin
MCLTIFNAEERIQIRDITLNGDSLLISMPFFNSLLYGKVIGDTVWEGRWIDRNRGEDYSIPFRAVFKDSIRRFDLLTRGNADFSGKWSVTFSPDSVNNTKAIGLFYQNGDRASGTFLTEMGDYRYLEGNTAGNQLAMSCFDGSHAFLFKAEMRRDGSLDGKFWSGNHWSEKWTATRDSSATLRHPDSLTSFDLKKPLNTLSFLGSNDRVFVLDMNRLKDKVTIVQIMGSWCPNCADESRLFGELYRQYHKEGLEIVGVSYEKVSLVPEAFEKIAHFKKSAGVEYPIVYGGSASKKKASEDFYMLGEITSFPTAVIFDKNGEIRKVHTGFYGPGTGEYYSKFKGDLEQFIANLLLE